MPLRVGDTLYEKVYVGADEQDRVYQGANLSHQKAPTFVSFYDRNASFDGGTRGTLGSSGRAQSFYPGSTQTVIPNDASRYRLVVDGAVLWRASVSNTGGWSPWPASQPNNIQYFTGAEFHALNRAWLAQGSARYGGGDFNRNWQIPFAAASGGGNVQVIWGIWGMVQGQPRNNAGWSATPGVEIPLVGKIAAGTQVHHVMIERIQAA